jgi:hypothetical protein
MVTAEPLVPLSEAVLPLIRARSRDLWRYAVANVQGTRMHEGVELLEVALEDPDALPSQGIRAPTPRETHTTTHKALASAIRVIARADDSAGIIGDACRALIELHPRTAAVAGVPGVKLADWVYDFHFDDDVDYFELDPVAYAPALGEKGLARLRARIDALRAEISPVEPSQRFSRHDHRTFVVEWFDKRFAVLDRDHDAIIRTHLRDGRVAAWHEDVAKAFEEIGSTDLAIHWAERATLFDHGHQARRAADHWWRLLQEHCPEALPESAKTIFDRWPTAGTGARLVAVTGEDAIDSVQETLAARPTELVRFQLDTMRDPRLAWTSAERLALDEAGVWADLAKAYLPFDPIAAIGVQLRLVAGTLIEANTRKYRPAARELASIRKTAVTSGAEAIAVVDDTIADLRDRYKRRPSLIAALDRARLP